MVMDSAPNGDRGSSKRRRTSTRGGVPNIADLSGDTLAAIADYLPKTSRALFAVALTAPPSAWRERGWRGQPSEAARAVLSSFTVPAPFASVLEMNSSELKDSGGFLYWSQGLAKEKRLQQSRIEEYYGQGGWGVLDFLDIEAGLASKLTDDDIGATLACIDARSNLKKLYLTKCSSFIGHGLDYLRGRLSLLERIDLDIAPDKKPNDCCFSLEVALPIIGDISAGETSAFWCIKIPSRWLLEHSEERKLFTTFLKKHKHALNVSAECCYFSFDGSKEEFVSRYLREQRDTPIDRCPGCGGSNYVTCADCSIIVCEDFDCRGDIGDPYKCDPCSKFSCRFCILNGTSSVQFCNSQAGCNDYCDDCRYISCRDGSNDCRCCKGMVFDRILQENTLQADEIIRLRAEIMELRQAQETH